MAVQTMKSLLAEVVDHWALRLVLLVLAVGALWTRAFACDEWEWSYLDLENQEWDITVIYADSGGEPEEGKGDGWHQGVGASKLSFHVTVTDNDKKRKKPNGRWQEVPDSTRTYHWEVTGGTVSPTNTFYTKWTAPATPGAYTLSVTVTDDDNPHPDTTDPTRPRSHPVRAIHLEDAKIVYYAGTPEYPQAEYPYDNADVDLRLVVQAKDVDPLYWYCGKAFDNGVQWYKTGTGGYRLGSVWSTLSAPETWAQTVYAWPTDEWPALDGIGYWKKLWHHANEYTAGEYTAKYEYTDEPASISGWGEDDHHFGDPGQFKLKACATGDYYVQQRATIPDGNTGPEYATRICVASTSIADDTNEEQREAYLEWLSTYLNVPYEWGGNWYGGRYSGTQTGGNTASEGYGCDCSGLVSCGARRALGEDWSPFDQTTVGIAGSTDATDWDDVEPGDIFNDHLKVATGGHNDGRHVMTPYTWTGSYPTRTFTVIEETVVDLPPPAQPRAKCQSTSRSESTLSDPETSDYIPRIVVDGDYE